MRRDIEILKSLYLPEIEEMNPLAASLKTSVQQEAFWDYFNTILFDAKEIANFLNIYKVASADLVISRFEQLKKEYISYLASDYCNGEMNPTVELFLKLQFQPFIDEVTFQEEIKQAVIITEREKLKRKLSLMDEAAAFEIADDEITSAFQLLEKKNEHEKLKEKMKEWDIVEPTRKPSRTIPLSFIKYAVAACFVGAMVWIGVMFYNSDQKENNLAANKSDSLKAPATIVPQPEFVKVEEIEKVVPVLQEHGLSYGPSGKANVTLVFVDLEPRIASIRKYITDQATSDSRKLVSAQSELDSLMGLTAKYKFDGKSLQLFGSANSHLKSSALKTTDRHYYYKEGNYFFFLQQTDKPIPFVKVTDKATLDKLDRMVFDNEK